MNMTKEYTGTWSSYKHIRGDYIGLLEITSDNKLHIFGNTADLAVMENNKYTSAMALFGDTVEIVLDKDTLLGEFNIYRQADQYKVLKNHGCIKLA